MNFNPSYDFRHTLEVARAERVRVEVLLRNGKVYNAMVGDVGQHNAVLTQLAGKEMFDALIRIDEICSVESKVRAK